MKQKTVIDIAEGYGLTIETSFIAGHEPALRVYKGANQIFIGTEAAVREFLSDYGKNRRATFEASMSGYRE